ncbi:MAG: hypothetical protein Q9212_007614 [Teloschistes hypoglaucus]
MKTPEYSESQTHQNSLSEHSDQQDEKMEKDPQTHGVSSPLLFCNFALPGDLVASPGLARSGLLLVGDVGAPGLKRSKLALLAGTSTN